jgi:hypothetical protein
MGAAQAFHGCRRVGDVSIQQSLPLFLSARLFLNWTRSLFRGIVSPLHLPVYLYIPSPPCIASYLVHISVYIPSVYISILFLSVFMLLPLP